VTAVCRLVKEASTPLTWHSRKPADRPVDQTAIHKLKNHKPVYNVRNCELWADKSQLINVETGPENILISSVSVSSLKAETLTFGSLRMHYLLWT
jgi:hypothetical protein